MNFLWLLKYPKLAGRMSEGWMKLRPPRPAGSFQEVGGGLTHTDIRKSACSFEKLLTILAFLTQALERHRNVQKLTLMIMKLNLSLEVQPALCHSVMTPQRLSYQGKELETVNMTGSFPPCSGLLEAP